jgi:ATP-binding cassette subfamily B protein
VGRTSITVAHRLSTIQNSDEIFVINGCVITERGTHKELLENGKEYAKMAINL